MSLEFVTGKFQLLADTFQVGCAHLIVSLTTHCPHDLSPHAGKILGVLLNSLNDRNRMVRKSYASAIGHVVKVSSVML